MTGYGAVVDRALQVEMLAVKCVSKKDQVELSLGNLINIVGAEEQHQQNPELKSRAMGVDNSQGVVAEGLECDMIVEEKEVMNARKLAIWIDSLFSATDRNTEVEVQEGSLYSEQEEAALPWGGAEGHKHGQPDVQETREMVRRTSTWTGTAWARQDLATIGRFFCQTISWQISK